MVDYTIALQAAMNRPNKDGFKDMLTAFSAGRKFKQDRKMEDLKGLLSSPEQEPGQHDKALRALAVLNPEYAQQFQNYEANIQAQESAQKLSDLRQKYVSAETEEEQTALARQLLIADPEKTSKIMEGLDQMDEREREQAKEQAASIALRLRQVRRLPQEQRRGAVDQFVQGLSASGIDISDELEGLDLNDPQALDEAIIDAEAEAVGLSNYIEGTIESERKQAEKGPLSSIAKLNEDLKAGRIDERQHRLAVDKALSGSGLTVQTNADGTVTVTTGSAGGMTTGARGKRQSTLLDRADANKRVIRLIDRLAPLLKAENIGATGSVKQFITGLIEQGDATIGVLLTNADDARADARQYADDSFDLGKLDPRAVGQVDAILNTLAYAIARRDNQRVTDQDFKKALEQIGATGSLVSVSNMAGALGQQRSMSVDQLREDSGELQSLGAGNPIAGFEDRLNANPFETIEQEPKEEQTGQPTDVDAIINKAVEEVLREGKQ